MATGRLPDPNTAPLTAKGDLYTYSTRGDRLAVGSNGDTLVADSSATTGLRWQGNFAAGKNAIINGDFRINQRNFTSNTANGAFNFDRWYSDQSGGTVTITPQTFTPGAAPVAGYEGRTFVQIAVSGQSGANYASISQKIEDVRTFAGQTITISFWAKASSGTPQIYPIAFQRMGTGGSPSAATQTNGTAQAISTSWARYSWTITLPSLSGKTLGTNNDSSVEIELMVSGAAVAINNVTFQIWGVQVEAGSVATAFQTATGTLAGELAACQRYFMVYGGDKIYERFGGGSSSATTDGRCYAHLPVPMRTTPTLTTSTVSDWQLVLPGVVGVAATAITLSSDESSPRIVALTVTIGTNVNFGGSKAVVLAGNNSTNARINLSAEL